VTPHYKLTPQECEVVLAVVNSEEFKDLPPRQIVPRLADQGRYLASESIMQRLLRHQHQNTQLIAHTFRRPFGMSTMWYFHFHFAWFRLPILSIWILLSFAWRLMIESFQHGHPYPRKSKTLTVSPAKPGDYLFYLAVNKMIL
jgi:hypothetical protein